ncbi:FAD-dependent monooxygenase [Streptomyces sp. V4-01]|uniref:FAD-dependent monooxygenase n=1 Tax=Actinacidiphila polyblastidii TaxID=3110430 RepID=A0ABU7P3G3_9ACTN|nr:FAD-dependent monooxygenase [Streptomyces sp. V4-01]
MTQSRDRAIVLGGSIAGTLAARVLADSYREVLVVDRDRLHGVREPRRGAPHNVHAHGLLARGQEIMEELFPGITEELVGTGVPTYDLGEIHWYFHNRRVQLAHTGLLAVAARRPVLEAHLRDRVAALPNVVYLEQHDILQPQATEDGSRITGVQVRRQADGPDAAPQTLEADLVVDATGRGSRTPAWLEQLGYQRPEEERIRIGLGYTTRHYRMPRSSPAIHVIPFAGHHRGAFFAPVGPDTYIVSLTGMFGDHSPTDHEGFEAFLRSLDVPDIAEALRNAEPIDQPARFAFPASVRRRFERLAAFPDGLLVMGDAVASFSPVYGQGMSVAALQALTLRAHLARPGRPSSAAYFKDIAAVVDLPWEMSAGGDLAYPEAEGPRPPKVRFFNAYMARLQRAASKDPKVTEVLMRVAGLLDPPQALLMPGILLRVLIGGFLRPAVPQPVAPPSTDRAADLPADVPAAVSTPIRPEPTPAAPPQT